MRERVVTVTEFKAKCLAILDEIDSQGGRVTVTRRGKPLAVVERPKPAKRESLIGRWEGILEFKGDLIEPLDGWECAAPEE